MYLELIYIVNFSVVFSPKMCVRVFSMQIDQKNDSTALSSPCGYFPEEVPWMDEKIDLQEPRIYDYHEVDKKPRFPGGEAMLVKYIKRHIHLPEDFKKIKTSGVVHISFIIDTDGKITEPVLLEGIHPLVDISALEVVEKLPAWKPAKHHGSFVPVKYTVGIRI